MDALTDPFAGEIGRRALAEVILLGAVCGPLGAWVVLYRQSYAAESIAHAALPGLVLAALAGLPILLGAAGGLALAAVAIGLASRKAKVGPDTAVAVTVTTLFGAGILLALSPDVPVRLGEILFGDPLSVSGADLAATAALALVLLAFLRGFHRRLTLAGFDPQSASSLGVHPRRVEIVLLVLLAGATLVAVQALGNLLVVALLVAPGAAALQLSRNLGWALAIAATLAVVAGLGGLYASYYLEVAAGASIALAAITIFALSTAWSAGVGTPSP
jgi:ABC-type Mn2+/Zn2+ transport system permease subunit